MASCAEKNWRHSEWQKSFSALHYKLMREIWKSFSKENMSKINFNNSFILSTVYIFVFPTNRMEVSKIHVFSFFSLTLSAWDYLHFKCRREMKDSFGKGTVHFIGQSWSGPLRTWCIKRTNESLPQLYSLVPVNCTLWSKWSWITDLALDHPKDTWTKKYEVCPTGK